MSNPVEIKTKKQMYELLFRGAFGNRVRMWNTLPEVFDSGYTGLVSMRSRQVSNPVRKYHCTLETLEEIVSKLDKRIRDIGLVFSEAPPDHKRTIQGEVAIGLQYYHGLTLRYSYYPMPMRIAFDHDDRHATGSTALAILRYHLWPQDFDNLMELLEKYPGHVVEFTGVSVPVGIIPNSGNLIWEVRKY